MIILFFLEVLMYTFLTVTLVHLIFDQDIFFLAPDSDIIKIHVFKGMSHVHSFGLLIKTLQ